MRILIHSIIFIPSNLKPAISWFKDEYWPLILILFPFPNIHSLRDVCMAFSLNHSLPMPPFSTTLAVFWCYQWVEKGCTGNKWVNIIRDRAHNRPKRKKIRESSVFIKKNVSISKRMLMTIRLNIFRFKPWC